MENLKSKFYDKHYLYFSALEKAIKETLDKYNINNPQTRSVLSVPIGAYLVGKDSLGRTLELIENIGEKLFEYPPSYYQKKFERELRNEK